MDKIIFTRKAELQMWEYPDNYVGEDYSDYYVVATRHRDSDVVQESNFESALKMLGGEHGDQVMVARASHWAVGWVEMLLVHKDASKYVLIAKEIHNSLEDYPILDEDDWSQKDWNAREESYDNWARDTAMEIIYKDEADISEIQFSPEDEAKFKGAVCRALEPESAGGYYLHERLLEEAIKTEGFDVVKYKSEKPESYDIEQWEKGDVGKTQLKLFNRRKNMKKQANLEDQKDKIIADLVEIFGEDAREEITDSLDFKKSRYSNAGNFEARGIEYNLIIDEDEAVNIAEDMVREDLQSQPENFNQNWLQSFIKISDTDKRIIAGEEADSLIDSMDDEDILREADMIDEYEVEEDDGKKEGILSNAKEQLQESLSDEIEKKLDDPIRYFVYEQGMYSMETLMKSSFIIIDIDRATEEAVSTDGWAHFLSTYDGEYKTTEHGYIYFRE